MTTASSVRVNNPQANTHVSSGVSDAGKIDLAVLTLDDQGMIRDCSRACEQVFGYPPEELAGRHVSMLLPQLPDTDLVQEGRINARPAGPSLPLCRGLSGPAPRWPLLRQRTVHQPARQPQRGRPGAQPRSVDIGRWRICRHACPLAAAHLHLPHGSSRSDSRGRTIRREAAIGRFPEKPA